MKLGNVVDPKTHICAHRAYENKEKNDKIQQPLCVGISKYMKFSYAEIPITRICAFCAHEKKSLVCRSVAVSKALEIRFGQDHVTLTISNFSF